MITGLGYGTYFLFASFMVLMGFWAFFFIPETKGLSLEDMDRIFGVPERAGLGEKEQQVEQVERVDYGVRREDL